MSNVSLIDGHDDEVFKAGDIIQNKDDPTMIGKIRKIFASGNAIVKLGSEAVLTVNLNRWEKVEEETDDQT